MHGTSGTSPVHFLGGGPKKNIDSISSIKIKYWLNKQNIRMKDKDNEYT